MDGAAEPALWPMGRAGEATISPMATVGTSEGTNQLRLKAKK